MTSLASRPQPDCLLTLAVPQALEEEILDLLWAHPEMVSGFTLLHGQGMGTHVALASAMEQVQGRARQVFVQVALTRAQAHALLRALHEALPRARMAYWIVPLLDFGHVGETV